MKTPPVLTESHPPRLIPTLVNGFNIAATNIWLILFPLALDLLLWLGPKLRLQTLLLPKLNSLTASLLKMGSTNLQSTLQSSNQIWTQLLGQFNLGIMIRTIPIGIPSLVAREMISTSPLTNTLQYQVPTMGLTLLILLGLLLLGYFLGTIYFNALSRYSTKPVEKLDFKKLIAQYWESLIMAVILVVVVLMLTFPIMMLLSAFSLISPNMADFVVMVGIFILVWLTLPLIFSPHGIFVINQKAFSSMMISMRMVRYFLPGTGMFIVTAALISEGLNMVWTVPGPTSWLTLIGIGGHAFIVTGLISASFIYYREGLRWMQDTIQRMSAPSNYENGGPFGTNHQ